MFLLNMMLSVILILKQGAIMIIVKQYTCKHYERKSFSVGLFNESVLQYYCLFDNETALQKFLHFHKCKKVTFCNVLKKSDLNF